MKLLFTSLFLLFLSLHIHSVYAQQTIHFSGQVSDQTTQPLPGATVQLKMAADLKVVQSTSTDSSGKFRMVNLNPGKYQLSIQMMGYLPYAAMIQLDSNTSMPAIALYSHIQSLKSVNITASHPLVDQEIDRTIIHVDANIGNAGSTLLEALEKSPGVVVDQSGAVTLKGKSATVFIDDKPTYLSGADLNAYLNSLPSSAVDQIELMSNPPAKYDASGTGGIINIRTKKGKLKGINGGLNLSYIQGKYARTNNSANMNYRNNKINLFGNLNYSTTNFYSDMDFYRHYVNSNGDVFSNFLQNSYTRRKSQNYTAKAGIDYTISDYTTIGMNLTGVYRPSTQNAPVNSIFTNAQNVHDSTVVADNRDKGKFKNSGINFNYRHQFGKSGRELTADFDYLHYHTDNTQSFNNNSYQPDGTLKHSELLTGSLPATIKIYTAKADYSQPFKNGIKFASGLKTSNTHTDNRASYFYTTDVTVPDYSKTNHFLYQENINAAYINANKDFNRLSVQVGLRLENTSSNGHQLGNAKKPDSTFKSNYTNLFPTLYLQYKLDSASVHQLTFSYGRRIERPYFQDLNPFLSPLDKFTYYTGNPFLKPSFTDALELSHTFKNKITTSVSYSKTHDQVNETIEIVDGIYYSKPGNVGSSTFKSISIDGSLDPLQWLNLHLYGQVSNIHARSAFYTGPLDTKGTFYYIKPILQFKPGREWILQLDGYYQSKVTNVQFIAGVQKRVNFAASKKLSSNTTLKLAVNDIFHSYVNSGIINNLALTKANYRNVADTRTAVLSLSYRFGKAIAAQHIHEANGADSEKNRVKN